MGAALTLARPTTTFKNKRSIENPEPSKLTLAGAGTDRLFIRSNSSVAVKAAHSLRARQQLREKTSRGSCLRVSTSSVASLRPTCSPANCYAAPRAASRRCVERAHDLPALPPRLDDPRNLGSSPVSSDVKALAIAIGSRLAADLTRPSRVGLRLPRVRRRSRDTRGVSRAPLFLRGGRLPPRDSARARGVRVRRGDARHLLPRGHRRVRGGR